MTTTIVPARLAILRRECLDYAAEYLELRCTTGRTRQPSHKPPVGAFIRQSSRYPEPEQDAVLALLFESWEAVCHDSID